MMIKPRWVVCTTYQGRERWAAENVLRQIQTTRPECELYLPLVNELKEISGRAGQKILRTRACIPGYFFVRVEGHWRFLTGTFGVGGVVMGGSEPATLPDSEILKLRMREIDGIVQLPKEPVTISRFVTGQVVNVLDGPFATFKGIHAGLNAKGCAEVLLNVLGRKTKTLISEDALEAA